MRKLKEAKAEKDVIKAEVDILLKLKNQLAAVQAGGAVASVPSGNSKSERINYSNPICVCLQVGQVYCYRVELVVDITVVSTVLVW